MFWGSGTRNPPPGAPFESGIVSEGSVHIRISVKFYLVATFFVVFDLEAVFILLWAVAGRELGWAGYGEILIFHRSFHAQRLHISGELARSTGIRRGIARKRRI